jgi:hypothetical protein
MSLSFCQQVGGLFSDWKGAKDLIYSYFYDILSGMLIVELIHCEDNFSLRHSISDFKPKWEQAHANRY